MKNLILLCLSALITGCAGTNWQTRDHVSLNSPNVSYSYDHDRGKTYSDVRSWTGSRARTEGEWDRKRESLHVSNPVVYTDGVMTTHSYGPGAQLVWPTVPTLGGGGPTQPLSGQHGTQPIRQ